jgi:glutathione S-transferase
MLQPESARSANLQLYYSPTSPYVRKVMVTAHEVGVVQRLDLHPTDVWSEGAAVTALNPLGQIPTLICDDGATIYDSPVICEYLDSAYGNSRLVPQDGRPRWEILRLQALGDGLLNAAIIRVMEVRRRPESLRWHDLLARQRKVMARTYDALEHEAASFASALDLGQIAIGCALAYIDLRLGDDDWRRGRPALRDWFRAISERQSFVASAPPGAPSAAQETKHDK